jgi:hypothetical protein
VYRGSRPHLPVREGSGAPRVLWLRILPPYQEGSGAAITCPAIFCGPQVSSIKKNLVDLPMQLGTYVPHTRAHVFKAPDIRAIMGLQDVRTSGYSAATVSGDATGRSHAADRTQHGR